MGSCSSVDESQESKEDKNSEENFPKKQVDREMLVQTRKMKKLDEILEISVEINL